MHIYIYIYICIWGRACVCDKFLRIALIYLKKTMLLKQKEPSDDRGWSPRETSSNGLDLYKHTCMNMR